MREKWRRIVGSQWFWLGLILVVQTLVYLGFGAMKTYFHMDEVYSYGLSNYDRVQIYETEDFYDTWHAGEYYDDYLTVGEDERWKLWPVYANQRDDVHPPLFYLLLRIGMELTPGVFSKWTGIVLNTVVFAVNTVFLYWIVRRLLGGEKNTDLDEAKIKSLVLTLVLATTMAAVSTVVYIRMYALLTLWVTVITWLHLGLLSAKKVQTKTLVAIGVVAWLGVLTQYYFIFYLVGLFIWFTIWYLKRGRRKEWQAYLTTLGITAVVSLIIWPYSIQHMFFGYRGQGVLGTLLNPGLLLDNLWQYMIVVDRYVFHKILLLAIMIVILGGAGLLIKGKKIEVEKNERQIVSMILVPSLFYFVIVAAASPFVALRYVAPVCTLLLMITIWWMYEMLGGKWKEKTRNIVMAGGLILFSMMPVFLKIEPDVVYRERGEMVAKIDELKDVPMLYLFKTGDDWGFLNDILLVRKIKESYLAKDVGADTEEIRRILEGKDLSKGLLVFINDGQDNEALLKAVKEATGLEKVKYKERIVMSDVYYLK